jgi:hypothetical protein
MVLQGFLVIISGRKHLRIEVASESTFRFGGVRRTGGFAP